MRGKHLKCNLPGANHSIHPEALCKFGFETIEHVYRSVSQDLAGGFVRGLDLNFSSISSKPSLVRCARSMLTIRPRELISPDEAGTSLSQPCDARQIAICF